MALASTVLEVPITEILIDEEFNCRGQIAPIDVVDLAKDIERQGLIQPVTVMAVEGLPDGKKYKLLAGFRRCKAHIVLKKPTISAVIRLDKLSDADARVINLAENLHRKDLNVLQEAKAIRHLFIFFGEAEIANRLGQSRGWVQIRAMLLKLPEVVQKEVEAGMISHTNIRELYAIHRAGNMDNLYAAVRKIKDGKLKGLKKVTVNPAIIGQEATGKLLRNKKEMEAMTMFLVDRKCKGLHTRLLAWAAGNVSTEDIVTDITAWADDQGIEFIQPTKEELEAICAR